jgi:IMP dehydrogenase
VQIIDGVSRTFNEYLLLPNRTRTECLVQNVSLAAVLVRHRLGEAPRVELILSVPFSSAIMQAVSSPDLAIALARNGGIAFLHHNQSPEAQADAVREVKKFKAGFVVSDTNVRPGDSLGQVTAPRR